MNRFFLRAVSALLALSLLNGLTFFAAASAAMGEEVTQKDTPLHHQTQLSETVFWSSAYSDQRTEHLVTYTPSGAVRPTVRFGDAVAVRGSVADAAAALEAEGYRVVAGINGDFYDMSNGVPLGIVMRDGQLYSSDGGHYAVGFRDDGTAILGKPAAGISVDLGYAADPGDGTFTQVVRPVTALNKARSQKGLYLYTYDFNAAHTTGTTQSGVTVICTLREDQSLGLGRSAAAQVEWVEEGLVSQLQPGQIALSANSMADSYYTDALRNMQPGTEIRIDITAAPGWETVRHAVGALYLLAENGTVAGNLPTGSNPRTAVGQKADGSLVFYTVDGRRSGHSIGATLAQVGQRLVELGCQTVLCLDGGGSTNLAVTAPDAVSAAIVNRPSEAHRKVSNQIFLVADGTPSGQLDHFYVKPSGDYVLAGSSVTVTATGVDSRYFPMDSSCTLSASAGQLEGNVLKTPAEGGEITVTAQQGGHSGSAVIHAVAQPDAIGIKSGGSPITALTVSPGSVTALTPSARWNRIDLTADAGAFSWSVEGNIGTVDQAGVFTATAPGTGAIVASLGRHTVRIGVTVDRLPLRSLEDFEGDAFLFVSGQDMTLSPSGTDGTVQLGRYSGRVDYALTEYGGYTAVAPVNPEKPFETPAAPYTALNFWLWGDGSGNLLEFVYGDGTESGLTLPAAVLDFTGWRQFNLPLPGRFILQGLQIQPPLLDGESGVYAHTPRSGTLYLDQITAAFPGTVDTAGPKIDLALHQDDGSVTARVSDDLDGILPLDALTAAYNGAPIPIEQYDAAAGTLRFYLPAAGEGGQQAARVTVTARDASGNIGRASIDIEAQDTQHQFSDLQDYWAAPYADFLYTAGITSGYSDGTFRPNQNISRAQFAVMLYRYLRLDEGLYADVALPFADLGALGEYALPAVRALYALGVITGTQRDGQLYLDPNGSLTRAQAAAMIGRTQLRGYALADLTFTDAGDIPAYAQSHIRSMVGQGVLSGYDDGTFRPGRAITRGQMAKILYQLL